MYKTELTEQILKSPMAQKVIQQISPLYGEAYTVLWLIQVIGSVLDTVEEWTGSLPHQVVPQTATWSLPYWEEQYDIFADPTWDYERRRQNILNKCRTRGPMNPYKLEKIVSVAAGAEARIEENTGMNHFTVYIAAKEKIGDEEQVRKEIDKVKPAHLVYTIIYEKYVESTAYICGTVHAAKEVTLEHYCNDDNDPDITLQEKYITENGIYTADEGYDGIGKVTVDVDDEEDIELPSAEAVKF